MTRLIRFVASALLVVFGSQQHLGVSVMYAQAPIAVFITAPTRGGFIDTDKQIQDSISDMKSRVSKLKGVKLVPTRDAAHIILTMVARGVGSRAFGERLNISESYAGVDVTQRPIYANTYWATAIMQVGDYKKELSGAYTHEMGYSLGAWGDCATQITRSLGAWIEANRDQVLARK